MISPHDYGLPARFPSWYPHQEEAFEYALEHPQCGISLPTGGGKSAMAVLLAIIKGTRTVILTATKALQDQYVSQLGDTGLVTVRGQNAYPCRKEDNLSCEEGPCHIGVPCDLKGFGCAYYDALSLAKNSDIVVTNYAYWMAQNEYSDGLGDFEFIVMDEAHLALSWLSNFLTISLARDEMGRLGIQIPELGEEIGPWQQWAGEHMGRVRELAEECECAIAELKAAEQKIPQARIRYARGVDRVKAKLVGLVGATGEWALETSRWGVRFQPVWPSDYTEILFRDIPEGMLMSATLVPKTMELLGKADWDFVEYPSEFPVENRLVTHIPTARMNFRAEQEDINIWMSRIDRIISQRKHLKGIIHTTSYSRRNTIMERSEHRDILLSHGTGDVFKVVNQFKRSKPPVVLVSPVLTTGWDIPECDYAIIAKVPYPDTSSPVVKKRMKRDKEWPSYEAMCVLVQESGRHIRGPKDRGEILIVDDDFKWFWGRYQKFSPLWFRGAVRFASTIPSSKW